MKHYNLTFDDNDIFSNGTHHLPPIKIQEFLTISNEEYLYKLIIINKRDKQQKILEHIIEILH